MGKEKQTNLFCDSKHVSGNDDNLRSYMRIKLEMADVITSAMNLAKERNDGEGVIIAQKLLARIAEDRFNLVVTGLFNRGKSSLMNAILGADCLPVGILPLTSVITTVTYGSRERLLIQREGWSLPQEEPISAITEYVTESGNSGNHKMVTLAEVQIPAEILRRGFHFIDTPGIGSALLKNTAATETFLPEADAIIFVTSFEFPLTDTERQFLQKARRSVGKIFLVINKADLVSARERDEILGFLRDCLEQEYDDRNPKIFALSARTGLTAKLAGQSELIAESGLAELEKSLIEFMAAEKSKEFLVRLAARIDRLLQRQNAELLLGRHARDDPEYAATCLRKLGKSLEALLALQREIYGVVSQRIRVELPAKLRPELSAATAEAATAASKFLKDFFLQLKLFSRPRKIEELAETVNSICAVKLSEHMNTVQAHLGTTIQELGGDDLKRLCKLPGRMTETGGELLELPQDNPEKGEIEDCLSSSWSASFVDPHPTWKAPHILWMYRIPIPTLRQYILRKCFRSIAQALLICRDNALELASQQAHTRLENMNRDIKTRISARAQRLKDILHKITDSDHLNQFKALMERMVTIQKDLDGWSQVHRNLESETDQSTPVPAGREPCVICSKALSALFDFFSKNQYELIVDQQARNEHAKAAGFCPLHTWHYAKIASPVGICFTYAPLLSAISQRLRTIRKTHDSALNSKHAILRLLPDSNSCPACKTVKAVEEDAANDIVTTLLTESTDFSGGVLCLPHLAMVVGKVPCEFIEPLLQQQAEMLERIAEDMRGYSLKHHSLRRALMTEDEQRSARRGLIHTASYPGFSMPWKEGDG
jgi:GTP-binding protein EngB required for normal cell division